MTKIEKHKTTHKKEHNIQSSKKNTTENVWMYISVGLGIAFIIALIFALSGATSTQTGIGTNNAKTTVVNLLTAMQPGTDVNVVSVTEVDGFYNILLNIQGQKQNIYITKDGKYIASLIKVSDLQAQLKQKSNPKVYALPQTYNTLPTTGDTNSKIAVVEFSDFQCPFCGLVANVKWANKFKSKYGQMIGTASKLEEDSLTGNFAFKQAPVAINTSNGSKESIDASNAALCAKDQNKYWEMAKVLYNAQKSESDEYSGKFSKDNLKILAKDVNGLDLNAFNQCIDNDTHVDEVKKITQDFSTIGSANTPNQVGTPTFYIVVDASVGKDKIENAIKQSGSNFTYAPTSDGSKYVIIVDPYYNKIKSVINALTA